jgi:hypothetical protein
MATVNNITPLLFFAMGGGLGYCACVHNNNYYSGKKLFGRGWSGTLPTMIAVTTCTPSLSLCHTMSPMHGSDDQSTVTWSRQLLNI